MRFSKRRKERETNDDDPFGIQSDDHIHAGFPQVVPECTLTPYRIHTVAFHSIPLAAIECLFGRDIHMLSLNAFSRLFGKIPFLRDIWFEFSMVRIPWYLLVIWVLGSVAVFLYQHFINFKFEKFLYENRVQIEDENVPFSLYYVPDLRSSCVFKVKGK